jgi:hypothetical protein
VRSLALFLAFGGCVTNDSGADGGVDMAVFCQTVTPSVQLIETFCPPPSNDLCYVTTRDGFY